MVIDRNVNQGHFRLKSLKFKERVIHGFSFKSFCLGIETFIKTFLFANLSNIIGAYNFYLYYAIINQAMTLARYCGRLLKAASRMAASRTSSPLKLALSRAKACETDSNRLGIFTFEITRVLWVGIII